MPFRSEEQRRWMWANKPKMAKKWTDEHGSTPVKAKVGKYQEFKHPQHDILPLEHMEESVSSKERVERLLDERKKKKESKKKLVKEGQGYVPGWRPNLSVKATEGELVREKTRGTGAAVKGTDHYVMQGMDAAQEGKLIQVPTRGTGQAVKGTDHYVMQGMDAAKTGKMIKAQSSAFISPHTDAVEEPIRRKKNIYKLKHSRYKSNEPNKWIGGAGKMKRTGHKVRGSRRTKINPLWIEWKYNININGNKEGKMIKAKKGIWSGAATSMYDKPSGWDVKKISDKTHKKLTKLWKHRETGGWKSKAGKDYSKYLKSLKKLTTKTLPPSNLSLATKAGTSAKVLAKMSKAVGTLPLVNRLVPKKHRMDTSKFLKRRKALSAFPAVKSKSFYFSDVPKPSKFLQRRVTLGGAKSLTSVLKAVGKRTGIGKAVVAASVVAGAYEAGKRKLFTKKDKKKVDKKSIGGETVVMKSGGGYIDNLL